METETSFETENIEPKRKHKKYFALKITACVAAAVIVLYVVIAFAVSRVLLNDMFGRVDYDYSLSTAYTPEEMPVKTTPVSFKSGDNTLRGHVWGGDDLDKLVVIVHGLGGSEYGYCNEAAYFVGLGYRVLTYNNTGTCASDGKGTTGLSQSALDLHSALTFKENNDELKDLPTYLFGHSWGGHAVTAVLNYEHKNIKAVASVAGYNSNGGIMLEWMKNKMGMGGFAYPVFPFAAACALADAKGAYYNTGVGGINKVDIPVLAVQGGKDETVWEDSIYNHREEITNKKFEYVFIENGTHNGVLDSDDPEIIEYRTQVENDYDKLAEQYGGNIPYDIEKAFFAGVDKSKYNGINNFTMNAVSNFFAKA